MIKRILAFSITDVRNILRDSTLLLMMFGTIGIVLLLKLGVPPLTDFIFQQYQFNLTAYNLYIVCFMGFVPSLLFGMISGFVMLDERDEEIITFISVTPMGKFGYIVYKLLFAMITSFVFYFIIIYTTGLIYLPPFKTFALAAGSMFIAPVTALILVAFAGNKVEGLVLAKVTGIQLLAPLAVFFIPGNWQYVAAVLPTFWLTRAFVSTNNNQYLFWFYMGMGYLLYLIFFIIFLKCFLNKQR